MQPTPQQQAVAQVYELMLAGDSETASSLAEEILADSGEEFSRCAGRQSASAVVMAATAYGETLIKSGRVRQAVAVLANALMRTSACRPDSGEMMTACITMWHAIELLLTQTSPDSAAQRKAIEMLASRLATLLYGLYYKVGHTNPAQAAWPDAYSTLQRLSNLVAIDRDNKDVPGLIAAIADSARKASLL